MKLEFNRYSSEALDEIFNAILIEDWKNVKDECKRMKKSLNEQDLAFRGELENDYKYHKKIRKAYETIIRYSLPYEQTKELLGEEK